MKSKKLMQLLVIFTMLAFFMFGCGKAEVATDTNAEKEGVVVEVPETTTAEEEVVKEEASEVTEPEVEEAPVEEPVEQTLQNADVWEDVKETEDVCIVTFDEKLQDQTFLTANGIGAENVTPYIMQKGEKVYIPLRDNITNILLYYCDESSGSITVYAASTVGEIDYPIVDIGDNLKAIEVVHPFEKDFNLSISVSDADDNIYFLIGYDNQ